MANQRDISLPEAIFVHHAFGGIQITHNKRHLWIILENENETRNLLRARLDKLAVLIRQTEQEQRVQNSYGQFSEHSYYPDLNLK
ncbi:flagellar protein FliT [Proteus mirabilis]